MGKVKQEYIKKLNGTRQEFLLSFFNKAGYQELEVNGFWLVKQMNGDTNREQVAIFTKESFERYKSYKMATKYNELRDKPRKCKEGHIFGELEMECGQCKEIKFF